MYVNIRSGFIDCIALIGFVDHRDGVGATGLESSMNFDDFRI
jgi:hypothetical protein